MNIEDMSNADKKDLHDALIELSSSKGWQTISSIISTEIEAYYRKLSSPTNQIGVDTFHYHRGIIEGSHRMLDIPSKIIKILEEDARIQAAKALATDELKS